MISDIDQVLGFLSIIIPIAMINAMTISSITITTSIAIKAMIHTMPTYDINPQDKNAMHIDGTFIPLGPGKLLVNPKRPCITGEVQKTFTYNGESRDYKLPPMFKGKTG